MRNAAHAKMGYYPCPPEAIRMIAEQITAHPKAALFDPCCGEGEAVNVLADAVSLPRSRVWTCELDGNRSAIARDRYPDNIHIGPADFFDAIISSKCFSMLWCNPPFDDEMGGGSRVEGSFLSEAMSCVAPRGVVVLICPEHVVDYGWRQVPRTFMQFCSNVAIIPFPEEHRNFGEVAVIGQREAAAQQVDSYSAWEIIKKRDWRGMSWFAPASEGPLSFAKGAQTDEELRDELRLSPLWKFTETQDHRRVERPPLPLSRGHIALLLAGGMLNGVISPPGERPHVVRGTAGKKPMEPTVEDVLDEEGNVTKTVTTIKETICLRVRTVDTDGTIKTLE